MSKRETEAASRQYWRSIDRLLDSPGIAEAIALDSAAGETAASEAGANDSPEFPVGADLPPDAMTRRTMMTLMGASFAFAGATGCRRPVEHIVPYVDAPEGVIPGIPRHYATTIPFGSAAYGAVVESHEGRPQKIEGNEHHPASRGAASAWMQAAVLDLYDPDRALRHTRRGDGDAQVAVDWPTLAAEILELRKAANDTSGAGWGVLVADHASPTVSRLLRLLGFRLGDATIATYSPIDDDNILDGIALATGTRQRPVLALENAEVIVAADADLLGTEADSLRNTRGFTAARSVQENGADPVRLYAIESTTTVTGANADHRLRTKRADVGGLIKALAAALSGRGIDLGVNVAAPSLDPVSSARINLIADDLVAAGKRSVLAVGRTQPPAVHALAHAINHALGAVGETVNLASVDAGSGGGTGALATLAGAMRDGSIQTLFILGGNPVFDAPAELGFGDALAGVENVIHLSTHHNETTALASHHVLEASTFEAWGDARSIDGTLSVVQPLIAPLLDGKSAVELLTMLAMVGERPGYETVRDTWYDLVEEDDFDAAWRRILHDGVYEPKGASDDEVAETGISAALAVAMGEGSAAPAAPASDDASSSSVDSAAIATAVAALPAPSGGDVEVTFDASRSLFDGRFANNAWLQELPDPITKIVWDNAALLSPATADRLGVEDGDILKLSVGDRSIEIPAWRLPGQADDSIALEIGFGRTTAGRVGNGVGVDVLPLRTSTGRWSVAATVEATGTRTKLVQTQEHWSLEGRPLYRETDVAGYRADPHFAADAHTEYEQPFDAFDYSKGHQWGMAIDLGSCTGCNACVVACQAENNIPVVGREQVDNGREMHWLRIDRYFTGELDDPGVAMQPVPCMHCENAPCEQVCPVAATVHDEEGLNAMVYNRCIGTRYCSNNCPYKVRRFNFFNYTKDTSELMKLAMNPDVTVRSRGVMEKCTYCVQRINETKIEAKRDNRAVTTNEVKTACQQTCPADAIVFGDLNDKDSSVVDRKADPRNYVLLGDLNNRPRTSYLGKVGNPNPEWPTGGQA